MMLVICKQVTVSLDYATVLDMQASVDILVTPDKRYIVVRGRLWRAANPHLPHLDRDRLVHELMDARRRVRSKDPGEKLRARKDVDAVKRSLGERGPVWWSDGLPDYNRHLVKNTPYRDWYYRTVEASPAASTGS